MERPPAFFVVPRQLGSGSGALHTLAWLAGWDGGGVAERRGGQRATAYRSHGHGWRAREDELGILEEAIALPALDDRGTVVVEKKGQ